MRKSLVIAFAVVAALACRAQIQAFRWVDTWQFSGFGITQTEPVRVWGKEWRLAYQPKGMTPFAIELHDLQTGQARKLASQVRKREVVKGSVSGDGPLNLAYLRVESPVASWSMIMSQYIDKPDEWQFIRWQSPQKKLQPFGSWNGEPGSRVFSIEVTESMGRMTLMQNGGGRVEMTIVDESGLVAMKVVSLQQGKVSSWFYKPGVYTVTVNSLEASWGLMVETVVE